MKNPPLLLPILALVSTSAFAANVEMRGDCEQQVRLAVAAAELASNDNAPMSEDGKTALISEEARNEVKISNTRVIKVEGQEERVRTTYKANVGTNATSFKGTVVVTATRGGCFINSLHLN